MVVHLANDFWRNGGLPGILIDFATRGITVFGPCVVN
jgi:hypothetical protein